MAGKYESQKKWKAKHSLQIRFDLYENNSDMIAWLKTRDSLAGYLKDLIRADMSLHPAEAAAALESYAAQNAEPEQE